MVNMNQELFLLKTLKMQDFININIDQAINYLETLEYDIKA